MGFPDRKARPQFRPTIPAVHIPEDEGQGRFNQEILSALTRLIGSPLLSGVVVSLKGQAAGAIQLPHGLGRTPIGVVLLNPGNSSLNPYNTAPADDQYVYLTLVVVGDWEFYVF